jgi:hypothetical protein
LVIGCEDVSAQAICSHESSRDALRDATVIPLSSIATLRGARPVGTEARDGKNHRQRAGEMQLHHPALPEQRRKKSADRK